MALRCLLVGLVASLGFELPSNQDVTSWTVSGRNWVSARTVDLLAFQAEASGWLGLDDPTMKSKTGEVAATCVPPARVAEATTETAISPADLAFDSIGEGMSLAFVADLETARSEEATATPVLETESALVAVLEPQIQPGMDQLTLAFPAPSADSIDEEGIDQDDTPAIRAGRLSSAVRLTQEAIHAWASVIETVGDDVIPTR